MLCQNIVNCLLPALPLCTLGDIYYPRSGTVQKEICSRAIRAHFQVSDFLREVGGEGEGGGIVSL